MNKIDQVAMFNRSDLFYKTMYEKIINPIFDAKLEGDLIRTREMVKKLIIYTRAFISDKDDIKCLKSLVNALEASSNDVIKAMSTQSNITQQTFIDLQSKKAQAMTKIDNVLTNLFQLMHKYNLFVNILKLDHTPALLKSRK